MGVLDKFLDIMKLSDDDDYEDDDFFDDDDYEEDYEPKPKRNLFRKDKEEAYDDEDDYELPARSKSSRSANNNKVTPMQIGRASCRERV